MTAAIAAARRGALVTLFERNERVGKKLLVTGNGKCNLGNRALSEQAYYGSSSQWIKDSLERFGTEDTIRFFQGLGLLLKERNGYLYPACEQAAVVLDVLRTELRTLGVCVRTNSRVRRVEKTPDGKIALHIGEEIDYFDSVVLACGSKAAPRTGSDGTGYELAAGLGHKVTPVVPALVQLRCRENFLKAVSGVRTQALIEVVHHGKTQVSEMGELQLTDYGISGIPVFQVSRVVNYLLLKEKEVTVRLNLLPDYSSGEYEMLKASRRLLLRDRTVEEFFTGMLHKKLMTLFIKNAGLKPGQMAETADKEAIEKVFALCRQWTLHVNQSNSYDNAQVCAGGVDTREITRDMESKKAPGVFFAGEIMDVDGKCGGYNLQWAWCSGYLAGTASADVQADKR